MSLQSDITINVAKFDPTAVSETTAKFNEGLLAADDTNPNWWEVGAPRYRQMRLAGETSHPKPTILPEGRDINIPSRHPHRSIPCRLFHPTSSIPNGVILHIHGGGWVLMSEKSYDPLLRFYADASACAVVSVGYRLAPEEPFPAGVDDCFDAADHLTKTAEKEFGGPLRFVGGESAGSHLSVLTAFHLLRTFPATPAPSLLLNYGIYDLSFLPSVSNVSRPPILDMVKIAHFVDAFIPNTSTAERKSPKVSPLYEDLEAFRGRLPKALFTCGTRDCLIDDTVLMGTKWLIHGGEAVIRIYEGAPHGFITHRTDETKKRLDDIRVFIRGIVGLE